MLVEINVNQAEPHSGGLWSVAYGGGASLRYERAFECRTLEELNARLREVADTLRADSRLSSWPGFLVSARSIGPRKPNGWDKRRNQREVYVSLNTPAAVG